jgi:hypothetical protein
MFYLASPLSTHPLLPLSAPRDGRSRKKNPCSQVVKPWLFLNSDFERALTELHNWTSTGIHPPRDTCKDDVGPPHVRAKSADSESHNSVSTPSADCPLNEERNVVPSSTAARGGTGRRAQRRGARPRRITGTDPGWLDVRMPYTRK